MKLKLITPPGMLLTTALLVIYSAYAFSIGSIEKSFALLAGGVAAVIATYGAAMVRPWCRYLVYILTAGFIAKLFSSITDAVRAGYFQLQFRSTKEVLWSLTPSLLMVILGLTCCALVHRQFKMKRGPAIASIAEQDAQIAVPVAEPIPSTDS